MIHAHADALAQALAVRPRVALAPADKRACAVLVPLMAVDGEPHLLLTRRSTLLPHHQGQIAFPGGRHDPADDTLEATALREAHEEIGLAPADVQVLGALDDIETVSTRFVITPFVGIVPYPYAWRPEPAEVDAIFTVSLRDLRAPGVHRTELWDFGERRIPIDSYAVADHVIWGVTQRITTNLLHVLATLD